MSPVLSIKKATPMNKLQQLFDLQHFAENKKLQSFIDDTRSRYGSDREKLSLDELEFNAAGNPYMQQGKELNNILHNGDNK